MPASMAQGGLDLDGVDAVHRREDKAQIMSPLLMGGKITLDNQVACANMILRY